jgi:hypothetical protein
MSNGSSKFLSNLLYLYSSSVFYWIAESVDTGCLQISIFCCLEILIALLSVTISVALPHLNFPCLLCYWIAASVGL